MKSFIAENKLGVVVGIGFLLIIVLTLYVFNSIADKL